MPLSRGLVSGRGRAIEEVDVVWPVLYSVSEHIDHAALLDLALQAGEKAPSGGAGLGEVERLGNRTLSAS